MEKSLKLLILALLFFLPLNIFAQRQKVDLIISGGTIVTMNKAMDVINNGSVAVGGNKIVAIGTEKDIARRYSARNVINANGKAVIPGLINTHTHIPMTLFRGIADDMDLQEWLTKYIFPAEAKNVDENLVRIGTRLGLAEMIRGGTTTYCDMYYFEGAIADESVKAGVRGVLGQTLIDFPAPDYKTFDVALSGTEKYIKAWDKDSLVTPAVAPHAPYTVSEEHLKQASALARKYDVPLVMHIAEAKTETEYTLEKKGMRPVEYVASIGFFTDKTVVAHAIHVNDKEIEILKNADVGVAHNPQSNMKLAAGVAPITKMLASNLRLGLGTDSAASNNDLNMFEEMDTAAKLQKVFTGDPKAAPATDMLMMATIGGARVLHMEDKIGSIEAGKLADVVVVDLNGFNQIPMYNIYSELVYATKASDVNTVVINGRVVMRARRLLSLNEIKIRRDATLMRNKIVSSFGSNFAN
ncbi:MAG: amidohydrolase family protein [Pyrinomonadaceae bacterium]